MIWTYQDLLNRAEASDPERYAALKNLSDVKDEYERRKAGNPETPASELMMIRDWINQSGIMVVE